MRLAIFGATGATGQHLVRQALDAGHEVAAAVRNPDRLDVQHPRLEVVTVPDVTDAGALTDILTGRDAVLSALGAPSNKTAGIASAALRAITEAMGAAGVRRLVVVSAMPVGPMPEGESLAFRAVLHPLVSRAFRAVYQDLGVMERVVAASDTDWTVVRPPRLTDDPATGRYTCVTDGNVPGGRTITRADLAHAMLEQLADPATVRHAVGVATVS